MYFERRSGSEGWQENYKTLEDRKNCVCYKKPILRFQNEFFPFFFSSVFSSVFFIFHSHF